MDNRGVSPVIATILVMMIVISVTGSIFLWGEPYIDSLKSKASQEMIENHIDDIDNCLDNIIRSQTDASVVNSVVLNDETSVETAERNSRTVFSYTLDGNYDFNVSGLDDLNSDSLDITMVKGDVTREEFIWFNDSRTCFLKGTDIKMADGANKKIEDIQSGDWVKSYDIENSMFVNLQVKNLLSYAKEDMNDYYLVINNHIRVTPNHPLYVNKNWVNAEDIKIGDYLFDSKGNDVLVYSLERVSEKQESFDLVLDSFLGSYFADNMLAHTDSIKMDKVVLTSGLNTNSGSIIINTVPHVSKRLDALAGDTTGGTDGPYDGGGGDIIIECFMPDTPINMADGTYKQIKDIKVGDRVKVFNELTKTVEDATVDKIHTKIHKNVCKLYFENGKMLRPTANHPFYTVEKGWATVSGLDEMNMGAKKIEVGDHVYQLNPNGGLDELKVTNIVPLPGEYLTYNFVDMKYGTYLADDIVTHNTGEDPVVNSAPTVLDKSPSDSATWVSTSPTLRVQVQDSDGQNIDVTFYDASDNTVIGSDNGVVSGENATTVWSSLNYNTSYSWYVRLDDGVVTSPIRSPLYGSWSFTTYESEPVLNITGPSSIDQWYQGSDHEILWDYSGPTGILIDEIILVDSTTLNVVSSLLSETLYANEETFSWRIPAGQQAGSYKIFIETVLDTNTGIYLSNYSEEFEIIEGVPVLNIQPSQAYDFGTNYIGQEGSYSFNLSNSGTGMLSYTIQSDSSWLSVNPSGSGSIDPWTTSVFDISLDTEGMSVGNYTGQISISSNGGSQVLSFSLELIQGPYLSINTESFKTELPTDVYKSLFFKVWNSGGVGTTLYYNITKSCSWIEEIYPDTGYSTGERDIIQIIINTTNLSLGSYSYTIDITSNINDRTLPVTLVIVEEAINVTKPVTNSIYYTGGKCNISWEYPTGGNTNLDLELYKDNTYLEHIATVNNNDSFYEWIVPYSLQSSYNYKIRVNRSDNVYYYGLSNNFEIRSKDGLKENQTIYQSISQGDTYTFSSISLQEDLEGTFLIELWDDNYTSLEPIGRVWVFDSDQLSYEIVSDSEYKTLKYFSGWTLYSDMESEIVEKPVNHDFNNNLFSYRATQVIITPDSLSSASGGNSRPLNVYSTLFNSYYRENKLAYNIKIFFYGDEASLLKEYLLDTYPNKLEQKNDGILSTDSTSGINLVFMHSIVKIRLSYY